MSSPMPGKHSPFGSDHSPPQHTTSQFGGGAPKYINDFTKALAGEVRILLEEVGKLRDERRALQQEIAELMAMKSKHGNGGEYSTGWSGPPAIEAPPPPPVIEEPPPPEPAPPVEARPGWRTVHKKKERAPRAITAPPPATPFVAPTPVPVIPPDPPMAQMPSWAKWRPSPQFMPPPTPQPQPTAPPTPMAPPPRAGLFGPSTPPP